MKINTEGFFADFYKNARENSVLIISKSGIILTVNKAFMTAFGYKLKDVAGKHLNILFTDTDRKIKKPEREIATTLAEGSKSDNNYLLHKDGTPIWVMGESVLVKNTNDEVYLVKVIHDIHAQKQLEGFLLESNDFIDTIFDSITDNGLMIIDSQMKLQKVNKAFLKMFQVKKNPELDSRFADLGHPFWNSLEIKQAIRDSIVTRKSMRNTHFIYINKQKEKKEYVILSKTVDLDEESKKILLVIKEIKQK